MNTHVQVPVLGKAIRILYELADCEGAATSSSLARKVEVSQPTCYRILKTLEAADWIKPNGRSGYDLSMGLFPLAKRFVDLDRYGRSIQPLLVELSQELELTAKFSVRLGMEQTTIAVAQPLRPYGVSAPVGARYPVVWGASGAALLGSLSKAELERLIAAVSEDDWGHESAADLRQRVLSVRKNRVCENLGGHPQGIDTISTPVSGTRIAGAITLIGLRGDIHKGNVASLKRKLIKTAGVVAARIG
jgi:IclR family acetate operon transcriptional repressor